MTGRSILECVTEDRLEMMRSRHYLMESGRLRAKQLIICEETLSERNLLDMEFSIPERIISKILGEKKKKIQRKEDKKTYKYYLNLWFTVVQLRERRAEIISMIRKDSEEIFEIWNPQDSAEEIKNINHQILKAEKDIEKFKQNLEENPFEEVIQEGAIESRRNSHIGHFTARLIRLF